MPAILYEIHIPVGRAVRIKLIWRDVIHVGNAGFDLQLIKVAETAASANLRAWARY